MVPFMYRVIPIPGPWYTSTPWNQTIGTVSMLTLYNLVFVATLNLKQTILTLFKEHHIVHKILCSREKTENFILLLLEGIFLIVSPELTIWCCHLNWPSGCHVNTHFSTWNISSVVAKIVSLVPPWMVFIHIARVAPVKHFEGFHRQGTLYKAVMLIHCFSEMLQWTAFPTFGITEIRVWIKLGFAESTSTHNWQICHHLKQNDDCRTCLWHYTDAVDTKKTGNEGIYKICSKQTATFPSTKGGLLCVCTVPKSSKSSWNDATGIGTGPKIQNT